MLPLQPGDELFFQISSNFHRPLNHRIPGDLILSQSQPSAAPNDHDKSNNSSGKIVRRRRKLPAGEVPKLPDINNDYKKILHREVEKQRRREMSTLHATLRSLIPLEYLKGKRSMSDDMNKAVNYIKHLQRKIQEKGTARDELKKASEFSTFNVPGLYSKDGNSSCSSGSSKSVAVSSCLGGIEIDFDGGSREEGLPLSKVLRVLLEERISVVNCVSTKVNDRILHTVHAEVRDPWCLDQQGLQRRLNLLATSG